jgi:hypothetical protein
MYSQYPYRQPSAFTITWALYYDLRPYMPEKARASKLPFFMHRERGLHLDEREFTVDGVPVSATILGVALTCTHAGAEHARRGEGQGLTLLHFSPQPEPLLSQKSPL